MTDIWEIMGRMVTDNNFLQDLFSFPAKIYPVNDNLAKIPADPASLATATPNDDYDAIRTKVRRVIPDKPLSLMALGELLYALSFPLFRTKVADLAAKIALVNLPAPQSANDGFYIGLGAMVLDNGLRDQLVNQNAWQKWGFQSVVNDPQDQATLTRLLDVNQTADVAPAAADLCRTIWDQQCNCFVVEWAEHLHPAEPASPEALASQPVAP